jgi:MarR family transcriptional regulator for hemolysin
MIDRDETDQREQFGFRLGRLTRLWRSRFDEKMKPHGLTQARWVVMVHLRRGGDGFQQKALANFIGIEGPTLVHILDNLEKQLLIERRQDKADRRGKTVHLTDEGWRMVDVFDGVAAEIRQQHLADIPDADLAHCLAVFEHIENSLNQAVGDDVGGSASENYKYGSTGSD